MQRTKMQNGETKYADGLKHEVGSFFESWATETWHVITSVEEGQVGDDKVWLHTMRDATSEELAQRDAEKAEWDAKTSDERVSETLDSLANAFPGLDW